ncbi:MAG: hypothetical protein EAZ89_15805 [Bacteroidetes bacterium]|nr:MAG: hypothetical protein EAZ89_15805 [Bacteroidota bacterium]
MAKNMLVSTPTPSSGTLHCYHLPKGMVSIKIARQGGSVAFEQPTAELVPDPEHVYYLKYTASPFSSDTLDVAFSEKGFLQSLKTVIKDETGAFLGKIVELGSAVAEVAIAPGVRTRDIDGMAAVPVLLFSGVINPFDSKALERVNKALAANSPDMSLIFSVEEQSSNISSQMSRNDAALRSGVFCKPMGTYDFVLSSGENELFRYELRLPHKSEVHFIEIPLEPWVQTEFDINFDASGYPSSIRLVKPSTAMAMIELPLQIIRAIIELPAKLFQFRINLDSSRADALEKQYALEQRFQAHAENVNKRLEAVTTAVVEGDPSLASEEEGTRGLFDIFKKAPKSTTAANRPAQSGAPVDNEALVQAQQDIKKLQQDILVLRRRLNEEK